MRKIFNFVAIIATFLSFAACGSSKNAANFSYQQQMRQQFVEETRQRLEDYKRTQESSVPNTPTRVKRELDPCDAKAIEPSANLRASSSGRSYEESEATRLATENARNELARMIRTAVEGASQSYSQNATQNQKISAKSLSEAVMTQYVAEDLYNTPLIEKSVYDLSDGTIQVYVCLEMKAKEADLLQKINEGLTRDQVLENEYARNRFLDQTKAGLDEYKERRRKEAGYE